MSELGEAAVADARLRRTRERWIAGGLAAAGVVLLAAVRAAAFYDSSLHPGDNCVYGSYNGQGTGTQAPPCNPAHNLDCQQLAVSCCITKSCPDSGHNYSGTVQTKNNGSVCHDLTAGIMCINSNGSGDGMFVGCCGSRIGS